MFLPSSVSLDIRGKSVQLLFQRIKLPFPLCIQFFFLFFFSLRLLIALMDIHSSSSTGWGGIPWYHHFSVFLSSSVIISIPTTGAVFWGTLVTRLIWGGPEPPFLFPLEYFSWMILLMSLTGGVVEGLGGLLRSAATWNPDESVCGPRKGFALGFYFNLAMTILVKCRKMVPSRSLVNQI